MLRLAYLLTLCYGSSDNNIHGHNTVLVTVFGDLDINEAMTIVAVIIGSLVLLAICLLSVILILCLRNRKSVYRTQNGSLEVKYSFAEPLPQVQHFATYNSQRSKTSTSLYPTTSRTDSTRWLLNQSAIDPRLMTCDWAHSEEVIDARKTPKIARRSNVSGLVDFERVQRTVLPPPPPLPESHSYHSLFSEPTITV